VSAKVCGRASGSDYQRQPPRDKLGTLSNPGIHALVKTTESIWKEKPMFTIDSEQRTKIAAWNAEQDRLVLEKQRQAASGDIARQMAVEADQPYYGAIGGALTYCFTPTALGDVVKVKHAGTGAELDVSDYGSW
jgi:hypothetical protein